MQRWGLVVSGLSLALDDLYGEQINALILRFTNYSAIWTTPGRSVLVLFVGLNWEIYATFAVVGVLFARMIPKDPNATLLGYNNRVVMSIIFSAIPTAVEIYLNVTGHLVWAYPLYCAKFPWIMWFCYQQSILECLRLHDQCTMGNSDQASAWAVVLAKLARAMTTLLIFGLWLQWI
jgi:hypothetical protein